MESNRCKEVLVHQIQRKLESITDWLTKSGLKVNEAKTELCLFYKHDSTPINISINNKAIKLKCNINVLGVLFDSKLNWLDHVSKTLLKTSKALCAVKLIRKFFSTKELIQIVTATVFSILYYNSEIWHIQSLKLSIKQKILSSSACVIKACMKYNSRMISYENVHRMNQRATPDKVLMYKHSLALFKLYNQDRPSLEWCFLHVNQIFTSRQSNFKIRKSNNLRVGLNALANRFVILNDKIPLNWLEGGFDTCKIKCKQLFLKS